MAREKGETTTNEESKTTTQFRINRVKQIENIYADEASTLNRYDRKNSATSSTITTAAGVREALRNSFNNRETVVKLSKQLYATNPIYTQAIDYLSNIYMWRYKVTPHKIYTKSKAKAKKELKEEDFRLIYHLMLEVVDGLSIETKFPMLLNYIFSEGGVYLTTVCDQDSLSIDTLLLPNKYCRKIGDTQFGTAIIEFDFSYFDNLGLQQDQLKDYLTSFPDEFKKYYNAYKKDSKKRWMPLDPTTSTGILMNEYSVPTFFYMYGSILGYEKYQDNELERNENLLKNIVVQTMPHYEDKLLFEVDEVKALHQSMRKKIDTKNSKLVTTFGDIHVEQLAKNDNAENQVLNNAYKSIYNNAGVNNSIFTAESVTALKYSLIRDRSMVWKYVQALLNFYSITINNWFDFKTYQADIDILPISSYTYEDDIKTYKDNATLGVGKLDYIVASGIKQKNIEDMFELENFLHLEKITPMQTSYTQTAEDRENEEGKSNESKSGSKKTGIEPPEGKDPDKE